MNESDLRSDVHYLGSTSCSAVVENLVLFSNLFGLIVLDFFMNCYE